MASSVNKKFEDSSHLESYIMIWLDERLNQIETETIQKIQEEVRSIINCQKTFENLDECRHSIEKTKDTRLVIASNERLGKQLIPVVDHWQHISAVYLYHTDDRSVEEHSTVSLNRKIITTSIGELSQKLMIDQRYRERREDWLLCSFFEEQQSIDYGTTPSHSFMVFELLMDALLFAGKTSDMDEFINLCKSEYNGNKVEEKRIDEFQRTYTPDTSIRWYTRDCFVYRIVNKALRIQNIDVLLALRFLIKDIHEQLRQLHKNEDINVIKVYRGQTLPITDLERMKVSDGEIVSFHNFLSTTYNRCQAMEFVSTQPIDDKVANVLFEIHCNPHLSSFSIQKPFAIVEKLSYIPSEGEVLFTVGSHFRLRGVRYDHEHTLHIIQLICISHTQQMDRFLIEQTDKYQLLLGKMSENESKAMIYIIAGNGAREQKQFDLSLKYLQKALDIHYSIHPRNDVIINLIKGYIYVVNERSHNLVAESDYNNDTAWHTDGFSERRLYTSFDMNSSVLDEYKKIVERQELYLPNESGYLNHNLQYRYTTGVQFYTDELDIDILHYQKLLSMYSKMSETTSLLYLSIYDKLKDLKRESRNRRQRIMQKNVNRENNHSIQKTKE